jgi:hypothetical protein
MNRSLRRKRITRLAVGAISIAALAGAAGASASHGGGTPAVSPGYLPRGPVNTCFWRDPEIDSGRIDQLHQENNFAAPETDTAYYYSRFQLPPGARVTLRGQYPHARFMSYTTYKTVGGVTGFPATALVDTQIRPDRGSVNPFDAGAPRDGSKRSYSVTITGHVSPPNPAPNTFYAGQAGTTGQTEQVEIGLRVYRPDRGYDGPGGVPLASPTLTLANGASSSGTAACTNLHARGGISRLGKIILATEGLPPATYRALRDSAPAPHPATDPVRWYRFFNTTRLLEPFLVGTPKAGQISSLPSTVTGGFYSTPNNAYILGYADRTIGPNRNGHNILVLHAKMPTHPDTYDRETKNDSAGTQVRFWSICAYGSIASPPLLPVNSACVFDERVPTNAAGYYTIVVSLPQDRPRNATDKCGVAWMNWGTAGDGEGRRTLDILVIREQLDSRSYAQGIDKITTPDTERRVMGAHYPTGTYMTKSQFQKRSCSNNNR